MYPRLTLYSEGTLNWLTTLLQRETASWSAVQLSMIGSESCNVLQNGARGLLLQERQREESTATAYILLT